VADVVLLAGRRRELDSLVAVLAERRRGAVLVVGEAGIGKTRLAGAAATRAADFDVTVLTGSCLRLCEGLPFLPILDVLRDLGDLDDGGFIESAVATCPQFVRAEVSRLLPEQLEDSDITVRAEPDDGWRKQRLFEALRQLLAAASTPRGLAILIEDVHWADEMTIAFVDYLLTPGRAVDVPIVLTCRDAAGLGDVAWDEWLDRTNRNDLVRRLDLEPMTEMETAEHIELLVGSTPSPNDVRRVYRRSEGNAFFTEQLVMAAATDSRGDVLPASLTSLLLSRIGQVSEAASQVLAGLAVAGQPLDEVALTLLTDLPGREVRETLRNLMARRLLRRPDAAGRHQLRHALLAEAIYDSLLPGEQAELHARIAAFIAARGDPSAAAAIAEHFQLAGHPTDELAWRIHAARHADAVFAAKEAAQHWQRALDLSIHIPPTGIVGGVSLAQLYAATEDALLSAGDEDAASALAEDALTRLRDVDPPDRADVLRRAGTLRGRSDPAAGLALLQEALDIYGQLPPSAAHAYTLAAVGRIHHNEGRTSENLNVINQAATLAGQVGDQTLWREARAIQVWYMLADGDPDQVLAQIRALQREAEEQDDLTLEAVIAIFHTSILEIVSRLDEMEAAAMPVLQKAASYGLDEFDLVAQARGNLCFALIELGSVDAAMHLIEPLTNRPAVSRSGVDFETRATLEMLNGNLHAARGRWDDLRRLPPKLLQTQVASVIAEAELDLWTDRPADAYQRCVELLNRDDLLDAQEGWAIPLLISALRACADLTESARAKRSTAALHTANQDRDWLADVRAHAAKRSPTVGFVKLNADIYDLEWQAEMSRADGKSSAELWRQVAATRERQHRKHRAAYAHWRQAEALLSTPHAKAAAAEALKTANKEAARHTPLRHAIEDLARRARLDLNPPAQPTGPDKPTVTHPFGLTDRELAVLKLVGQGKSNPEIAASLYMSAKTVSVHVTHILRKLNASTRVQAATLAERAGLLDNDAKGPR
jgi:DNA-binding NarL/FixJ family response regulator